MAKPSGQKLTQDQKLSRDMARFLQTPFWPAQLDTMVPYSRTHDDHDGTWQGQLTVTISGDGDAWLMVDGSEGLRFRNFLGGGRSPRVRNALLLLALAIKLDNEADPEPSPKPDSPDR